MGQLRNSFKHAIWEIGRHYLHLFAFFLFFFFCGPSMDVRHAVMQEYLDPGPEIWSIDCV